MCKTVRPELVEGFHRTVTMCPAFTLIECMIVLALCSLLLTLALVNTRQYTHVVVCAELQTLRSICAYLRAKAMAVGGMQVLAVDPVHHRYTFDKTTYQLPPCVRFGCVSNLAGPPACPRSPPTTPVTFKHNRILFYPTGIISSGTVYVTDRDHQVQYALSCGVSQFSFLRLYRYGAKWRCLSG